MPRTGITLAIFYFLLVTDLHAYWSVIGRRVTSYTSYRPQAFDLHGVDPIKLSLKYRRAPEKRQFGPVL